MSPQAMMTALLDGARPDVDALIDAFADRLPWLERLIDTPQDPEWHGEGDVRVHTQMVLDELYALFDAPENQAIPAEGRRELVLGALLHDVAKPVTTRRMELHGVDRVVAPRHEARGRSYLAPRLLDTGLSYASLQRVLGMVGSHHEPKLLSVKDRSPGHYRRISRRVDPQQVALLELADMAGRWCPDKETQLNHVRWFAMASEEYAPAGWWERWRRFFAESLQSRPDSVRDRVLGEAIRLYEADRVHSPEEAMYLSFQQPEAPPELLILVGPSGSGKSSFVARALSRGEAPYEVISLDGLREELAGDQADQALNGQVRQEAKLRLRAALRPGRRVVWDATNLRADFRAAIANTGFDYGALVTQVVFHKTIEGYNQGNRGRSTAVPQRVLDGQLDALEWPEVDEAHRTVVVDGQGRARWWHGFTADTPPWELAP